jgi:autophagy-related protein 2
VQARLVETEGEVGLPLHKTGTSARSRSSAAQPPPPNYLSEDEDDHVPTVDELAKSFLRTEPAAEIRELEQQLGSHSESLQDSVASSDDGDGEGSAGMGAPLALPTYLRNILNTALDRLSIVVNNINIEMQDYSSADPSDASKQAHDSPASIDFHIQRIAIDSSTSPGLRVEMDSTTSPQATTPSHGKRRMRVENICARLVSDAEKFMSMSRVSHRSSPAMTRSHPPSIITASSQSPISPDPEQHVVDRNFGTAKGDDVKDLLEPLIPSIQASVASLPDEASSPATTSSPDQPQLASSINTVDDDRFADASSDGGLHEAPESDSPSVSRQSLPMPGLSGSSILYDDDGVLEYALESDMFNSRFDDAPEAHLPHDESDNRSPDSAISSHERHVSGSASEASTSGLPTVSALGRSFRPPITPVPLSLSTSSDQLHPSTDNLVAAQHYLEAETEPATDPPQESPIASPQPNTDLEESQLFTHDDAESMYMSALSAAQPDSTHRAHVPGGWDSSSTSSRSTASENSGSMPEEMVAGSILAPLPEIDEGCETPRPRTPESSSPHLTRAQTPVSHSSAVARQAKLFLTIDEVTMWFPLRLDEQPGNQKPAGATPGNAGMDFRSPDLGEDSIFAEMPGSFSNYAHSSSQKQKLSFEASTRQRPVSKGGRTEQHEEPRTDKPLPASTITVEVGSVTSHIDMSTGRIMYKMLDRVLSALAGEPSSQQKASEPQDAPKEINNSFEVTVKHIGVACLENIAADSLHEGQFSNRMLDKRPFNAILRVSLEAVRVNSQIRSQNSRSKLQINKVVLASLDQDIVSFQAARSRSRHSVSALPEQLSNDVEIDFEQTESKRITILTRPIKITFDIQKLDDALGSFGGFSGVLELSSSISSATTTSSPVAPLIISPPRGVHFKDSPRRVTAPIANSSSTPKIQVQLGELSFVLKGKSCAVQFQTTSVRVALRDGNARLKVSEAVLTGPFVDEAHTGAPLLAEIKGTTVNFLFAPEEADLAKLISMITPSKDPYENNDDILIDTLLRQRRKGSVLRIEVDSVGVRISNLHQLTTFETLGTELARLSKVTKYLPDDDRPGLLTLASVQEFNAGIVINEKLGEISVSLLSASVAHVGVPALLAAEVGKAILNRDDEELVHEVIKLQSQNQLPAIMLRMVGDELEPAIKVKLFNVCVEYRVSTVMAALGLSEDGTMDEIALGVAASVATITGASTPKMLSRQSSSASSPPPPTTKPLRVDLLLRSCAIGLNPRNLLSKGLFVLTEAHVAGKQINSDYSVTLELRKASVHAIDDAARLDGANASSSSANTAIGRHHLQDLQDLGFVSLSSISAAKVYVNISGDGEEQPQLVDVEFKNELFILESCADSTQTLIAIINGLQPPTPPSTAERYRTVVPLQEMMESFTGDALAAREEEEDEDFMSNADLVEDEVPTNLEFVGSIYNSQSLPTDEEMGDSLLGEDDLDALATPPITRQRGDRALLESFQEKYEVTEGEQDFDFNDKYFGDSDTDHKGKARKWNSTKNQYNLSNEFKVPDAPLKVRVRDMNVIWNLFDGYDWPRTRNIISQAVDDVEARAEERRKQAHEDDEDDDFVEEDFLFNSVWIGVPSKDEKGALARAINHDIDDLVSETGSYATSTATRSTGATVRPRSAAKSKRRLKLERSKHKKIAFSLMGVAVDLIVFPPNSGETINSIDVRVRDFEIFDHVPSSTWKKFVTCLIDPSSREMNKPMMNIQILTVTPVTDLAASELVVKVSLLQENCIRNANYRTGHCLASPSACRPGYFGLHHPLL